MQCTGHYKLELDKKISLANRIGRTIGTDPVYCGVLGAPLVLSVLAAIGICVGHMNLWCLEHTWYYFVLAICIVGCLEHTWCKRGVVLVKFKTFPISYGAT